MKNFSSNGVDKSFIDCVQSLSRSLENRHNSPDLRDLFFKQIEKKDQLPENISEEVIKNFIYCLVEIAYSDPDQREALRALNSLFCFVKSDINVFSHFKPSRIVIRKLKLDKYLISSNSETVETILDFAIFLLRYYENVDYEDFSDLVTIIAKIKRAELHRVWIDIEEIIGRLDGIDNSSKQNLNNTSAAFGEIFSYMDKIKKEVDSCKNVIKSQGGEASFKLSDPEFARSKDYANILSNINPDNDKTAFDKRFNNFENKLEKLRDQGSAERMLLRPDETKALKSGYRGNEPIGILASSDIDEVKKMNIRLGKIESELIALRGGTKDKLQDRDTFDTFQNLASAMTNLSDRVTTMERLNKGGGIFDSTSGKQNDLDMKIKVSTLEKKLESLTERISAIPPVTKSPFETEKLKQDYEALETRLSKEILNVSDAYRKADFTLQNDLKRVVEMISSMQKDIQDLQNNVIIGATQHPKINDTSAYEIDFLKKKIQALETKMDKQPTKTDYDFLANKIITLEKPIQPLSDSLVKPQADPYRLNPTSGGEQIQGPFDLKNLDQLKKSTLLNPNDAFQQQSTLELEKKIAAVERTMKDNHQITLEFEKKIAAVDRTVKENHQILLDKFKQYYDSNLIPNTQTQQQQKPIEIAEMQVKLAELERKINANLLNPPPSNPSKLLDADTAPTNLSIQRMIEAKIIEIEKKINDINLSVVLKVEQQNGSIQGIVKEINALKQDLYKINPSEKKDESRNSKVDQGVMRIEKFVQEFVNRLAEIKIKKITEPTTTAAQKMDKFEWIVRNIEFISPLLPQNLLLWAQETLLDPREPNPNRDALTIARHNSEAVLNVINLIKEAAATQNPTLRELLDNYLSFLEIMLFSDINLDKALQVGVVDLLFHILDPVSNYTVEERRGALKSTLPCSRFIQVTNTVFTSKKYLRILVDLLAKPWDQDCLLSLANFFSKAFSEENKFGAIMEESRDLIKALFTCLKAYEKIDVLVEEILQIFMLLTENKENLNYAGEPTAFQKIIDLAKTSTDTEIKELAMQTLINASQNPNFAKYFKAQGIKI